MKLVKHASEVYPRAAAGPIMGFDVHADVVKITSAYPFPYITEESSPYRAKSNVKYQDDLISELKELNSAEQLLGWYQSSISGKFITDSLLEALAYGQLRQSANAIVLVHDQVKAKYGVLSLRAFRLTKNFLEAYIANDFSVESLNSHQLSFDKIFEELPVQIHNNHLVSLYLAQKDVDHFTSTTTLESTQLKTQATLANVESLIESVDDLGQFYYQQHKKKSAGTQKSDSSLQEWLPLAGRVGYTSDDVEQQVLSQFITDSGIKP